MSLLAAVNLSLQLMAITSGGNRTRTSAIGPEPRSGEADVAAARASLPVFARLAIEHASKRVEPPAKPSPLRAPCAKCKAAPGEECNMRAHPSRHRFHAARLVAPPETDGGTP